MGPGQVSQVTGSDEGENARGEHWYLKAGGSPADYYTMLETRHADGHRDEGGMGGASLYPESRYNSYTGRADDGPLRVIVRTDPRVRQIAHVWTNPVAVHENWFKPVQAFVYRRLR